MVKIFEVDFRTGSLVEKITGGLLTGFNKKLIKSDKGVTSEQTASTSYFTLPNNINIFDSPKTIEAWVKYSNRGTSVSRYTTIIGNNTIASGIRISHPTILGTIYLMKDGSNYRSWNIRSNIIDNRWHHLLFTIPDTVVANSNCYLDGVLITAATSLGAFSTISLNTIFYESDLGINQNCVLRVYDSIMTEAERVKVYADFLNSYPIELPKTFDFTSLKPTDLSREKTTGLVAAYNMIPNGNTLVDISGSGKNCTLTACKVDNSGIASRSTISKITTTNIFTDALVWTVNMVVSDFVDVNYRFGPSTVSQVKCLFFKGNTSGIAYRNSAMTDYYFGYVLDNKKTTLSFVSNGTAVSLYVNGVYISYVTPVGEPLLSVNELIGAVTANKPLIKYHDFRAYNRELSLTEIKAYHNQFVRPALIENFSNEGADGVAKVPSGWIKQSGSFKIGEYIKGPSGNLVPNGNFDTDVSGWGSSYEPVATVSFSDGKCKIDSTTVSKYLTRTISTLSAGKTYKVSWYGTTSKFRIPNVFIGTPIDNSSKIVTVGDTHTAIIYATGSALAIRNDNSVGPTTAYYDNITVEEIILPTFKNGTKYLECVTAGTIAIPSKQAYGTWEFDIMKGAETNNIFVEFMSLKNTINPRNGYEFSIASDERIYWAKRTNDAGSPITYTATGYVQNNTWYRIRVTRSISGVFTTYIKGGSFVDWTVVNLTGGSGTNPVTDNTYTSSEYLVVDLDAGDRITSINLYDSIKQ